MSPELTPEKRARRDDPLCVMQDVPLLWIDARFAGATMKRTPDAAVAAAPGEPSDVVDRIETELFGEADRYRQALWACVAICVMPAALAMLAWSAMYWLPVRIQWFPFERGYYGLPWLSLYEWVAYLLLGAFFAYGFALIAESRASTHRLSADYRRLADAAPEFRVAVADIVAAGGAERTALVLRTSKPFSAYVGLLDDARDAAARESDAQRPPAPWPVRSAFSLVAAVLALDLAAGAGVRAVSRAGLASTPAALAVGAIFALLYGSQIGLIVASARSRGTTLAETVGLRRIERPLAWAGSALVAALGLRIIATVYSAIMLALGLRLPGWNADPTRFFPSTTLGTIVLVLVVVIGAPITEEIVFRGIVLPSSVARWGLAWGLSATSVVFAAMHLSVFAFLPILAVAFSLAWLRLRSESLWPSMLCHAAFNGIGVLLVLLLRGSGVV